MPSTTWVRFSASPGKMLFWYWFRRDLAQLGRRPFGMDAACGAMGNRQYFNVDRYLGFDSCEQALRLARSNFPNESPILADLSQLPELTREHGRADVVCCVQTINTNAHFDSNKALEVVRHLANATAADGTLLVNVGSQGAPLAELEPALLNILEPLFETIRVRRYGAFHRRIPFARILSPAVALAMEVFPPLRDGFGRHYRKLYLLCSNRRP